MTQEEAIRRIKARFDRWALDNEDMKAVQTLISELAESEDERIRKHLIEIVETYWGTTNDPGKAADLAYLEKQKEQKHPNGCFTCDEYKKGYEEGRRNGFTAGYNKAMKEVEQKEQKLADDTTFEKWLDDWYQGSKEAGGDVVMSEAEFKNWSRGIRNMYQQKSAEWSEEDEGELQNAIDALEFLGKKEVYKSESGYDAALQAASWLKSIPERFNLQPKQE